MLIFRDICPSVYPNQLEFQKKMLSISIKLKYILWCIPSHNKEQSTQNYQFFHSNSWQTRTKHIGKTLIRRKTYVVKVFFVETSKPLDFDLLSEPGNVLSVRIYEGNIH